MNVTEKFLLNLLDCALEERVPEAFAEPVDWQALYQLALDHKVDGLILDTICLLPDDKKPPMDLLDHWQNHAMVVMMGQMGAVSQQHELLSSLEENGIHAVVIKGIALKCLYPQPDFRTMSDADLLVSSQQEKDACRVCQEMGYELVEEEPGVHVFQGADGLRVELHIKLFDEAEFGFMSRIDEEKHFNMNTIRREKVYLGEAWVYPPTEHLLFMLCHMAKHVITTGFGLRQAMDYILFVKKRGDEVEWERFKIQALELGVSSLSDAVVEIGCRYFHLDRHPEYFCKNDCADGTIENFLADILDAGVFGSRTQERVDSAAVVVRSVDSQHGNQGRIFKALFPKANTLKAPYLYARKYPFLLPIAWVHRWVNLIINLIKGKKSISSINASTQLADVRLMLLNDLGLRDGQQEEKKNG